jgi:hypothetical protein
LGASQGGGPEPLSDRHPLEPGNPTHEPRLREVDARAQTLVVRIERVTACTPAEIDQAFADLTQKRVEGVLVLSDPMLSGEE